MNTVKPYRNEKSNKKEQVAQMFDNIAVKYDFLNHFLSLNIDKIWRKKAIKELSKYQPNKILDIATGTGDLAIQALKKLPTAEIIGVDISNGMLEQGKIKLKKKNINQIKLEYGDSENLDFKTDTFDGAMVAFGVRNFENLNKGLSEIARVLKTGKPLIVLEFSHPQAFPIKQFYNFYSKYILPLIGKIFSKDNSAYTYLPESVKAFPSGKNFMLELEKSGFNSIKLISLSFGIASIYIGTKK
ncbi:MAG: bifunctional demethylmenaquinone methyltransferase/2-methoxy-6-polyprenyl-1,4-benzoquinol methylase UbiE [Bacteroidales bacterium]|nr:bifunctional demethylmenaquinone methyltransferase/2-methoxy-6-polyprenyl-1,4-benzoquinol methylase UbiE [Bacteroidales bacterium]